ncbi:MAG: hypothetical protein IJ583_03185 [Firmicutes bacterium]|nr:hypothetical protein [Bacillota bacterium]
MGENSDMGLKYEHGVFDFFIERVISLYLFMYFTQNIGKYTWYNAML